MYLVTHGGNAILIDPGFAPDESMTAVAWVKRHSRRLTATLVTHGHIDHVMGLARIKAAFDCPVYCHEEERQCLVDPRCNGALLLGLSYEPVAADVLLKGGELLTLAGTAIMVLHTPGHTRGSLSFVVGTAVFSGDILFRDSIGRTDLEGGDYETEIASIRTSLLTLPPATKVYPGHGPATTIGRESRNF